MFKISPKSEVFTSLMLNNLDSKSKICFHIQKIYIYIYYPKNFHHTSILIYVKKRSKKDQKKKKKKKIKKKKQKKKKRTNKKT